MILERASRAKICSNAGSGFELAPTAVEILENRLGFDVSKIISYYKAFSALTSEGKRVRFIQLPTDYKGGSINRAEMQNFLLELIFPTPKDEEGVLFCGSGIETYHEEEGRVVATLSSSDSNGGPKQTITGSILLACVTVSTRGVAPSCTVATTPAPRKIISIPPTFAGRCVTGEKLPPPRGPCS